MAPLEQKLNELSKRIDKLADKSTPTNAQNSHHHDAIETIIVNQQALRNELISSLRLFQEAFGAHSKQQPALFFSPALLSKSIFIQCVCIALLSVILLLVLSILWRGQVS
jgi:hypothetical protein